MVWRAARPRRICGIFISRCPINWILEETIHSPPGMFTNRKVTSVEQSKGISPRGSSILGPGPSPSASIFYIFVFRCEIVIRKNHPTELFEAVREVFTMSCNAQVTCEGCSCDGNRTQAPVNIENCEVELLQLRKRIKELEKSMKSSSPITSPTQLPGSREPTEGRILRSSKWFNDEANPGNTALYVERYLNYGMTKEELMTGKPVIGIAQSGSDLVPCNRHHLELVKRVREGTRTAGGIAFEFPTHPIQESTRRPTACLDRNFAYLGLVEILHGYPLDGVVLLTGCDKTTPASLMAAATVVSITFRGTLSPKKANALC